MPPLRLLVLCCLTLMMAAACSHSVGPRSSLSRATPAPLIEATDDLIRVHLPRALAVETVCIAATPAHVTSAASADILWRGPASSAAPISLPRRAPDGRDRGAMRFHVLDAATLAALSSPQWVTRLESAARGTHPFLQPTTKKGLSCPIDFDDARALGVQHVTQNISLGRLFAAAGTATPWHEVVDGVTVSFDPRTVATLDRNIGTATRAGMSVVGILINPIDDLRRNPLPALRHPATDFSGQGAIVAAFNVVSEEGLRHYRAALQFLLRRYTRADSAHGWLSALVVGNEVNSHYAWHNMGEAPAADVIREYAAAVRLAWLAAQQFHPGVRIYVSLEHHWTVSGSDRNALRSLPARDVLEQFAAHVQSGGDFPWQVAYHPYPADLFKPAFWRDRQAPRADDALKVSFRNLEVLCRFLERPTLRFRGEPRRIALTEQGFHCPATPEGEDEQAAAYALAYYKIERLPLVDMFLYHRHVDHPGEGGLRLGLRETRSATGDHDPGRARRIWDVVRTADTPERAATHAFALRVAGLARWEDAAPVVRLDETHRRPSDDIVFDFVAQLGRARTERVAAFRADTVLHAAGWFVPAILQHPPARGAGTATWNVTLPSASRRQRLVLEVGTAFGHDRTVDGVEFAIRADGEELLRTRQKSSAPVPHTVDVTRFAGRNVDFVFSVDPLASSAYDEAVWAQPVIRRTRAH